jgi:hypothetical protein
MLPQQVEAEFLAKAHPEGINVQELGEFPHSCYFLMGGCVIPVAKACRSLWKRKEFT